ncbi:hypothetical protein GCM10010145_48410 [Streptomyces ruber]|uniref:ABC transporter domain-containing protein n=2 Tax=Streptomyces TaxID=1883 RepID=A0A918BKE0_9ACTN|nr:ABC transporter ATP-binding protein [Streptomyces ruber]GGQ73011.1 hypothetical protein GCM10010145_48410 [Streptomyces ruber]
MRLHRHAPQLLRALRAAGGWTLTALTAVLLAEALLPAAHAAALGLLVEGVQEAAHTRRPGAVTGSLLVFGAVVLTAEITASAAPALTLLATGRVDGAHRRAVLALTTSCDLAVLNTPAARAAIRDALADRSKGYDCGLSDGALALLRSLASVAGLLAALAVIGLHVWWLPAVVLLPACAVRMLRSRRDSALMDDWRSATQEELALDVWRRANLSAVEGQDIRVFGLADWMVARMRGHLRDANKRLWDHVDRQIRSAWRPAALVAAGLLPAFVTVSADAAAGHTPAAAAVAVFAGSWAVFQVLSAQTNSYLIAGGVRVVLATREVHRLLTPTPAGAERADAGRGQPPHVVFEQVRFRYPGAGRTVLDGVDLEIRPGELLAVVGANGAGKTTLITLLCGLYQPAQGRLLVDGVDLAAIDARKWRERLCVVFQDFVRYPLTLAENIGLGRGDMVPEPTALRRAAVRSGLSTTVEKLPHGWDTPLNPSRTGGTELSGGQWQRVALTRALYALERGATLLVLDEPAAHLDVAAEHALFDRLAECRGEAGVVVISHRLSTVRRADRIVVLGGGRVVEEGTHRDLIARAGRYARMFAAQAERFRAGEGGPADGREGPVRHTSGSGGAGGAR